MSLGLDMTEWLTYESASFRCEQMDRIDAWIVCDPLASGN